MLIAIKEYCDVQRAEEIEPRDQKAETAEIGKKTGGLGPTRSPGTRTAPRTKRPRVGPPIIASLPWCPVNAAIARQVLMMNRTTRSLIRFTPPFTLNGNEGTQPARAYTVETDEEELQGLSSRPTGNCGPGP